MSMNIAVVVPGGIGEALQATPLLRTLRAGVPEAHITLLCHPDAVAVADGIPAVDVAAGVAGLTAPPPTAAAARLWFALRRRRLDAVLLCSTAGSLRAALYLTGTPRRLGVGGGLSSLLLTGRTRAAASENRAAAWLRIAALAGIRQELHSPAYEPGPEARREADRLIHISGLDDGRLLAALAPGLGFARTDGVAPGATMWASERFAYLANLLAARHGAGILLLGSGDDRGAIEQTMLDLGASAVDLSAQTDLRVIAGVLARCDLLVSGDTSLLHLAAAVGTAAVGLYGPTDGRSRGPYGADHRIIQALPRPGAQRGAMEQIRVEDVLAGIEAAL